MRPGRATLGFARRRRRVIDHTTLPACLHLPVPIPLPLHPIQLSPTSSPTHQHLHHLFNAETCQSYIHTLRWKDRPLQCPRCQSHNVGPWGTYHYQPGLKRYRCKEHACKRTFNDLTGTLLDGSKRSVMHWILATFLLCLSCASRRIARELGIHSRTSYRWCWWLRQVCPVA